MSRMADLDLELRSNKREILHAILQQFRQTDDLALFGDEVPSVQTYAADIVRMLSWEYLGGKRDSENRSNK